MSAEPAMTPGRLWLLLRKNMREGWSTPRWRDRVRPRILETAPVAVPPEPGDVEIFALTCRSDLLNLTWSLKSFFRAAGRTWAMTILDDGTLSGTDLETLARHFPGARLLPSAEASARMEKELAERPLCRKYRATHALARKSFDAGVFLRAPRMLLLDSDLLFFRRPDDLLRRIDDPASPNACNEDVAPGLNIGKEEALERFGIRLVETVNSGLFLLRRRALDLDWMEEFLGSPSIWEGKVWRIEQTLLALAACRDGVELLPAREYAVRLEEGLDGCAAKHYVGQVRHLMYREGIRRLVEDGMLDGAPSPGVPRG